MLPKHVTEVARAVDVVTHLDKSITGAASTLIDFGFTQAELDSADQAHIQVHTDVVAHRFDGGTPVATGGSESGFTTTDFMLHSRHFSALKIIAATTARVSISLEQVLPNSRSLEVA